MNNKIFCRFNFSTNLTPNFLSEFFYYYKSNQYYNYKTNKIFAKNFICFILILKYILQKSNSSEKKNLNAKFFFLPKKKKIYTILRAPYRYKLAKNQINFKRYLFCLSFFKLIEKPVILTNLVQINTILDNLIKSVFYFETNVISQKKFFISLPLKIQSNWILN